MSHARVMLAMIDEFVGLAIERRARQLPEDMRERMETLDERLREAIDGAKPAPKRIANPTAVNAPTQPPSKVPTTPPTAKPNGSPPATVASALDDALSLTPDDKKKVRSVEIAQSSYTPSSAPAYMHDYYSDDLVPVAITADVVPTGVSDASGESVDLSREVRVLLGLERPPPVRARANTPSPMARGASTSGRPGTPVIVHLVKGGTKRGQVEAFAPDSGAVELTLKNGATELVELSTVLAVFFGASKTKPATEPAGTTLVVKLVNDRQLTGVSPDYSEGAPALTVVPTPKRGNIDHIWVPAWAVKGIEIG